jgi:two-component system sensor histidine kinase ChvG
MLTKGGAEIDNALLNVRLDIIKWFIIALAVTILLSLYLSNSIARPILLLAHAAERVRRDRHREQSIPSFQGRTDEIAVLAASLREMTEALWDRVDEIERFAADVAHELKSPLTSLRSAVETVSRVANPEQKEKLLEIIQTDVSRLNRLISDISDASRVDAEMARAISHPVDIGDMLSTLVEISSNDPAAHEVHIAVNIPNKTNLVVIGIEDRLVQVYRNLIANGLSFSPPGGKLTVGVKRINSTIVTELLDEGPGIPSGKEKDIFLRFYSERPQQEAFGEHSGLGLSISKQIIEAHEGSIYAENRRDNQGQVVGARFVVELPSE